MYICEIYHCSVTAAQCLTKVVEMIAKVIYY